MGAGRSAAVICGCSKWLGRAVRGPTATGRERSGGWVAVAGLQCAASRRGHVSLGLWRVDVHLAVVMSGATILPLVCRLRDACPVVTVGPCVPVCARALVGCGCVHVRAGRVTGCLDPAGAAVCCTQGGAVTTHLAFCHSRAFGLRGRPGVVATADEARRGKLRPQLLRRQGASGPRCAETSCSSATRRAL